MKHGWFEIPGVQTGERKVSERVAPLRFLLPHIKGATILDLGCAEGVIGKWLLDNGAKTLHGIDKHAPWLEVARELMPPDKYDAQFAACDFDHFRKRPPKIKFLDQYDIVLALNVIQKLRVPRRFTATAAKLAKRFFVYSGPAKILCDVRSRNVPLDFERFLKKDFTLVHTEDGIKDDTKGHLGVRLFFRRRDDIRQEIQARKDRQRRILTKRKRK